MNGKFRKVKPYLWARIVRFSRNLFFYPFLYRSYYYGLFVSLDNKKSNRCFLTAEPNPGAGMGHQLANWIAGYYWAKQFGLKFAHMPFSNPAWEDFLSFGEGEVKVSELLRHGYKLVRIPQFSEKKTHEMQRTKTIIKAFEGKKVILRCESDQFYRDQYGVREDMQRKFFSARSRKQDKLTYDPTYFNVAIHIRRGDIVAGQKKQNPNLLMRWQDNGYFVRVLRNTLSFLKTEKPLAIYLFSQGKEEEFQEFQEFPNTTFCLHMSAMESFLHMVYADCLITSKSSFSYKPALLNRGIKVSPQDFWHGYPNDPDWLLVDEDGNFVNS